MKKIGKVVLLWDNWNLTHISRHSVAPIEVSDLLQDKNRHVIETYSDRLMVLARSGNRLLSTILSEREEGKYYVVTARDMSKKERKIYREQSE